MPSTLSNYYLKLPSRLDKLMVVANFLTTHREEKIIFFFNTCDSVDFYFKLFQRYIQDRYQLFKGLYTGKMHGDMKQSKRLSVFQEFNQKESGVLFATDVIARGIDFEKIDSIVQIDIPQDPNFYIHRIGRTARRGKEGLALVLVDQDEVKYIEYLESKVPNIKAYDDKDVVQYADSARNKFEKAIRNTMLTDKDFIIKSSRAFVSFIRSFKEHRLITVLKFKNLDIFSTAKSFFLFKMPVIKELQDMPVEGELATPQELARLEETKFLDKNQEKMIKERIEEAKGKSRF